MNFKISKEQILIGLAVAVLGYVIVSKIFPKKQKNKLTPFKSKLVEIANKEYEAWNKNGKIKEGNQDTIQRLRNYWIEGTNTKGTDKYYTDTAWSATFISWLMRMAGAGTDFKYSASHSDYIRQAIKNKKENLPSKFKGYKPSEVEVKEGDLVCYARQSGVNYDSTGSYMSHCDLVVDVESDKAISIGGNVSDSVTKTTVPLKDGKIDMSKEKKGYFVVIKNLKQ